MDASAETISGELLTWYDAHARVLPWRSPPGSPPPANDKDWPYRVWLSEVMLQQTTVAAVTGYYRKFLERWPSVEALAEAPEAEVMGAWAGLGYYARARNLHACARAIAARGGRFPQTEAELRALPGLGAYTAAAVAAIAFGQRACVVDANVERVIARLHAVSVPWPKSRRHLRELAGRLTPAERPGDFAQAMMDLGATICTARSPRCAQCPLAGHCRARTLGPEKFPARPAKQVKPRRRGTAYWIADGERVWLVRRPVKGMLGGMRGLPDDGWSAQRDGSAIAPLAGRWTSGGVVRHVFTHFALDLDLQLYSGGDWARLEAHAGEWWPLDRIAEAGLPTLFAKAARLALAHD